MAAASHTGSLAGSDQAWEALLEESGAVRVHSLDELVDMLVTFEFMPPPRGRNMVLCGSNGGFTVLTADEYLGSGFHLPQLPPQDQGDIKNIVSRFSSTDAGMILRNPFDITNVGSGEGHYTIMRKLAENNLFDLLTVQVSVSNSGWPHAESPFKFWPDMFLDSLLQVRREVDKPVAVIIHSAISGTDCQRSLELQHKCSSAGLPVYTSIPSAARAMDRFLDCHERRQR